MEKSTPSSRVTFPQCSWGCPARKMTTITSNVLGMKSLDVPCRHARHEWRLAGKDERGKFRTRAAQCYPSQLCRQIAQAHVTAMLEKGPSSRATEVEFRAISERWRQARAERSGQPEDLVPFRFLRQLG